MNLRLKIFTGILVLVAALVAFLKFMPHDNSKPSRNYFMGVDGDPRMRVCNAPSDAHGIDKTIVNAMKIGAPLQIDPKNKANYRISVFRADNQRAVSIEFKTPKIGPAGIVNVTVFDKGNIKSESQNLIFDQAMSLINAFKSARIWGKPQPTFLPKDIKGPASAIVEINAPNEKRCIVTRYDDEHIASLLREFGKRTSSVLKSTDISGFAPPEPEIFGKKVK